MLKLPIFDFKRLFTKPNGDRVVDLTRGSISFDNNPGIQRSIIITEEFEMRPDLISKLLYNDVKYLDALLKFNEISNPFTIHTGQILLAPSRDQIEEMYFTAADIKDRGDQAPLNQEFLIKPTTEKDKKRLENLQKTAESKEVLPPNINKTGDKNVKVKDGKIVFGEDVTGVNKADCPEPISRARLKERLTLNKIFQ